MLTIRPLQKNDITLLTDYWFNAKGDYLNSMGADIKKLPARDVFENTLIQQLNEPLEERRSYAIIWLENDIPVGHSNTNPTLFGDHAYMHLHLWDKHHRQKGLGEKFLRLSIPHYFSQLKLKELISEPFAFNALPHKALEKAGFEFEKEYITIPGSINFEQKVKRWKISSERYQELYSG